MKKIVREVKELKDINDRIITGMVKDIPGFNSEVYSDFDSGEMLIDETDPRNPLKYLTEQERNDLIDI